MEVRRLRILATEIYKTLLLVLIPFMKVLEISSFFICVVL